MRRFVRLLSRLVRRAPLPVLVGAIVLTAVLGAFAPQAQQTTGNEGFSPDNRELRALERAGEDFTSSSQSVMQVVLDDDDVISADGFAAVSAIQEAVRASDAAEHLVQEQGQPPIISFLFPVQAALAGPPPDAPGGDADEQAAPPSEMPYPSASELDDDTVDQLFQQGLEALPPEQSGIVTSLLPEGTDVGGASAPRGLMLVFVDTSDLGNAMADEEGFEQLIAIQNQIADAVEGAELPDGYEARAFAFEMLFEDQEAFNEELGRLFGSAFLIILVILAFVFFVRPKGEMTRARSLRRSAADVGLTLATIIMAITWMQGFGVLLGPDYLGLIGAFSPPTQIVPILLIGLGVDYSIHMTSRYREEIGAGEEPGAAAGIASRTVGVALVLATVTTAVGFLTNITNPLPALRDFGILAAVGIFAAFVLMLTFVPAVRLLLDRRAARADRLPRAALATTSERILPRLMARSSVLAERFAVTTLSVTLVLGGLGAWGLTQLDTTFSFTDFVPQDSPALATFEAIQEDFSGGFGETTTVLLDGDVATPDAHNALVGSLRNTADTAGVVTFGDQPAATSPVSVLAGLVIPPDQGGPGGPPSETAFDEGVARTATENGLQEDLTVAPDADVAAIYSAALQAAPAQAGQVLNRDGDGFTALVELQTSAGEQGAAELRRGLSDDFAPLEEAGVEVIPTSNNIVSAVIVKALQDSQIISLFLTLVAAMLLLVVTFWIEVRRPMLGVITIAPVVLVVLWTFGMMAATGIPFNPITAILSALAIGIGVPFTIHITHRFQEDRLRYEDPHEAIASTVRHTGGALAGSALTTIAGFGILITSSLVPFRQMGQVTAMAIAFALVSAVLVLPSMLILWDRWHGRRGQLSVAPTRDHLDFERDGREVEPVG